MVAPTAADNSFEFKYSVDGEIAERQKFIQYVVSDDRGFLWVGLAIGILSVLIFLICLVQYYTKKQGLRKNKQILVNKIEKEKQDEELK